MLNTMARADLMARTSRSGARGNKARGADGNSVLSTESIVSDGTVTIVLPAGPQTCEFCQFTTESNSQLKVHMRKHKNEVSVAADKSLQLGVCNYTAFPLFINTSKLPAGSLCTPALTYVQQVRPFTPIVGGLLKGGSGKSSSRVKWARHWFLRSL